MRSARWLIAAVLTGAIVMTLSSPAVAKCEPEKAGATYPNLVGKKIKIAIDPSTPPYTIRDPNDFEKIIGFDADLARAVFKCVGLQLEFVSGAWSGLLPSVIAGQNDYMQAGTGALVQKGNPKKLKSMDDTCGIRAAAGLGTVEEAAFRDQSKKCAAAGKPEIPQVSYPDVAGGVRLVQNDRADVMLTDLALVDQLARDNPTAFERGFAMMTGFKVGVAIKKGRENLLKALAQGIKEMQSDGTQRELLKKYRLDPTLQITSETLRN